MSAPLDTPLDPDSPVSWAPLLDPDEYILWQGRPDGGLHLKGSNLLISGLGVGFIAFSFFWIAMAFSFPGTQSNPLGWLFPMFGLPFVAVGLWLVFGVHVVDVRKRRRSIYALTNKRALIGTDFGTRRLKSHPISKDTALELRPGPPDTVIFAVVERHNDDETRVEEIGFEYIADGARVYEMIRKVQRGEV